MKKSDQRDANTAHWL